MAEKEAVVSLAALQPLYAMWCELRVARARCEPRDGIRWAWGTCGEGGLD
jgi:hypothetical protein